MAFVANGPILDQGSRSQVSRKRDDTVFQYAVTTPHLAEHRE